MTRTRAWDLAPGDILTPIGAEIRTVDVDEPGQGGRMVRAVTAIGTFTWSMNEFVTIQNDRETGLAS